MMNYEPGRLVSENKETSKNVVVESRIENLFLPKTSNEIISETTLRKIFKEQWQLKKEENKKIITENWTRGSDSIGYWKILYEQLKKVGIPVKYGNKAGEVTDPTKSSFMYWGGWIIWYSLSTNSNWPITFTDTNKKTWHFKFQGGKYVGQPVGNVVLESKEISLTFKLGDWGKQTNDAMTKKLAEFVKSNPKKVSTQNVSPCKTTDGKPIPDNQIQSTADSIFKDIAYAFDGSGTYEAEAVAAYARITCKPLLDKVNAKIAARGMRGGTLGTGDPIKNAQDWLKDEMSDYDYDQYRAIWANLQKVDKSIVAPKVDLVYKAAGAVGEFTGINSIEKATEGIQQLFTSDPIKGFEKLVDAIRSFLGGVVGGVVTTILDFTGVGKVITSIGWGIMLVFDIILSTIKGVPKIVEILLDIVNILTTGSVGTAVGRVLKPFMGTGSTLSKIIKSLSDIPWLKAIFETIEKGLGKVSSMVSNAIKWIMGSKFWKWLSGTAVGKAIGSVATKVVSFFDNFTKSLATVGGAGSKATTARSAQYQLKTGQQKIKDKLTKDAAEDLAWEQGEKYGEEYGGTAGKYGVKLAKSAKGLTSSGEGIDKVSKKIDTQRANKLAGQVDTTNVGKDVGKLSSVSSTTAKAVGTVGKDTIKTGENLYKTVKGDEEKNKPTNIKPDLSKVNRGAESTNVVKQPVVNPIQVKV